jgi:hypothetical protein
MPTRKTPGSTILRFVLVLFFASFILPVAVSWAGQTGQVATGQVEGKAVAQDKPVVDAIFYASKAPDTLFTGTSAVTPVTTGPDGTFSLTLPKGVYYIAARKKRPGAGESLEPGDLYSFYGGNPVEVDSARPAKITLNMVEKPVPKEDLAKPGEHGGVEGVATYNGQPLDGVVIFVYLDANDSLRGMGYYMSPPTGVDGTFKMKMSDGRYYILARKRINGMLAGPLHEGDYFGYLDSNPVSVKKGRVMQVEIPMVRKVEKASPGGQGRTVLSGVIKDSQGKPVPGMYACLYKKADMVDRPAFVSKPTGADGRFELEVPLGGTYYLGARDTIGKPVDPGQLWGRYNGAQDHSVTVETGKSVDGLEIDVEKVE